MHGLRGQTSLRKRLQYDMFYICNWTLGLDIRILLVTVFPFFFAPSRRRRKGLSTARPLEDDLQWLMSPNGTLENFHPAPDAKP